MREENRAGCRSRISAVSGIHGILQLGAGASLRRAVTAIKQAQAEIGLPLGVISSFQGAALAFQSSLSNQLFLIFGGDRHRLYRAGCAL